MESSFSGDGLYLRRPRHFIDGGPNRRGNSITRGSLLAGGCGCFWGFLKSTAVFWRNWSLKQKFYGKTLVKLFCCEFMLIILLCNYFIYLLCDIGKADAFCTRLSPASTRWPLSISQLQIDRAVTRRWRQSSASCPGMPAAWMQWLVSDLSRNVMLEPAWLH